MDKKKILIIGSIVAIIISLSLVIYKVTTKEEEPGFTIDGITQPENLDILKDTSVDNLNIEDASLITRNGVSLFKATVSNNTDKEIKINKLYVVFYEGEIKNDMIAKYNTTISPQEKTYISITSELDLTKTTKIEYVLE